MNLIIEFAGGYSSYSWSYAKLHFLTEATLGSLVTEAEDQANFQQADFIKGLLYLLSLCEFQKNKL